ELAVGSIVTMKFILFLQDIGGPADAFVQIGGFVRTAVGVVVLHVWVWLETIIGVALTITKSNNLKHFDFNNLHTDHYIVQARKQNINQPTTTTLDIPSPNNKYEIQFP